MHTRFLLPLFIIGLSVIACKNAKYDPSLTANTSLIHHSVEKTTEIIVTDIFSPVVAGRIYAYSNIALYETLRQGNKDYLSLAGQIRDLAQVPEPPSDVKVDLNLAGLHAYTSVAKALIFSEQEMEDYRTAMYDDLKAKGLPEEIFTASIAYGQAVADHILAWAKKDNYAQTR